jgi:phthalate 4,5-dioxygenase
LASSIEDFWMITHVDNLLLCQVEGQVPARQMMRQHWITVCLPEEVSKCYGTPVKAKIPGEKLVVFRDLEGRVGVVDKKCPHRGASLLFGRNEKGAKLALTTVGKWTLRKMTSKKTVRP